MADVPCFNADRHNSFSYCLAIGPGELNQLVKPASGLEKRLSEMEHEGGAIALSPGF